jgi:tRNA threonylcarbamoyladenosine modification (KEOPS) complex  Pcc1 subunit
MNLKPRTQAEAKILVETPRSAVDIIIKALEPELESDISDRSKVLIKASEKGLVIEVSAEEDTALRAAVNSYLYWIQGIMDIIQKTKKNEQ